MKGKQFWIENTFLRCQLIPVSPKTLPVYQFRRQNEPVVGERREGHMMSFETITNHVHLKNGRWVSLTPRRGNSVLIPREFSGSSSTGETVNYFAKSLSTIRKKNNKRTLQSKASVFERTNYLKCRCWHLRQCWWNCRKE